MWQISEPFSVALCLLCVGGFQLNDHLKYQISAPIEGSSLLEVVGVMEWGSEEEREGNETEEEMDGGKFTSRFSKSLMKGWRNGCNIK